MITLKPYQERVLDSLRGFSRQCAKDGHPEAAFQSVQLRNGRVPVPYIPVLAAGLTGVPYVCLRVPTGGGKTLLACYAAGLAMGDLLHRERAVVLWLVPSNTILNQTADALRDPRHAYRRALELACGTVEVVTIEDGDFGLSKDQVKISVGKLDELKDIKDIASPKCPVRVILTVEKLREGWDCPFAYVLCSLKETRSATAIEQIVGRILRLPRAQAKQHPDLNCAYAFSVSDSLPEVLNELREALESNGFTAAEAERIILSVPQGMLPLGVQPKTAQFEPGQEIDSEVAQVAALAGKVRIDTEKGELTVLVPLDEEETEKLVSCVKTPAAKAKVAEVVALVREAEKAFGGSGQPRMPSPYEQQLDFLVPLLCVREDQMLFEFESTFLLEHPWKLSEKDAALAEEYDPTVRPTGKVGFLDVDSAGKVEASAIGETPATYFVNTLHQQALALGGTRDWTLEELVAWLDRHLDHQDIPVSESAYQLPKRPFHE